MEEKQTQTEIVKEPSLEKTEQTKAPLKSSKLPLVLIVILLVLLIPLGGYFLFNEVSKSKTSPAPTASNLPTTEVESTPTTNPSPTTAASVKLDKSFTSAKFDSLSFEGYKLMYPSSWTLKEERDGTVPISTVTITKQGYTIKIFQAATGGAQCIYEGSMPEGPASDYRTSKFVDLTSFATLRQTESPANGKMAYAYCQKNTTDGSYGQPTSVGHMSVTTGVANADPQILSEIETIIESIQLVK